MESLVIYFSHIGENWGEQGLEVITKGNTEIVAEKIAKLTGATLFKVEPLNPYPDKYYPCCDKAKEELKNDERPKIKNELTDISGYEIIYIGAPVWWSHMPMPMFTQLEMLNFTGKIVMPFSTHEGSDLAFFMQDANKLCKGATIKQGLAIRGCKANECDAELQNWIQK